MRREVALGCECSCGGLRKCFGGCLPSGSMLAIQLRASAGTNTVMKARHAHKQILFGAIFDYRERPDLSHRCLTSVQHEMGGSICLISSSSSCA